MTPGASAPRERATGGRNGSESPVYAFLEKPSMIDYPGALCGVFFVSGCNFSCGFCHNALLMGKKQKGLPWIRLEEICRQFREEWVDAVCISGGEPTLAADLIALIKFFRNFGFRVKLDSNGGRPGVLCEALPLLDYVAMDIKTALSNYPDFVGFKNTELIAESIQLIKESGIDYEFRTTVIEDMHTDDVMREIVAMIKPAQRYCLQPFVPHDNLPDPYYRGLKRTRPERMREIEQLVAGCAGELIIRGA